MDHWWLEAWSTAERFTPVPSAEFVAEPETFKLQLRIRDDRTIRIDGDRNLLKHSRRQATREDIRQLGEQIARTINGVTGADWSLNASTFGSGHIFGGEEATAGIFRLILRTHGDRGIRMEGDRRLFNNATRLAEDEDIVLLGDQIVGAINFVTRELETTELETSVLDTIIDMTAASVDHNSLSPRNFMLARVAALIAMDAPLVSWFADAAAIEESGLTVEDIQGVMIAIAPVVGAPRVMVAGGQ